MSDTYLNFYRQLKDFCAECSQPWPSERTLVAVSKYHPVAKVYAAYMAGQRDFGENYVAELCEKAVQLSKMHAHPRWHFTGTLQGNKLTKLLPYVDVIHTLCSLKHARKIESFLQQHPEKKIQAFVCVNLGAEKQKSGVLWDEIDPFVAQLLAVAPQLELLGLMAIPPRAVSLQASAQHVPRVYRDFVQKARQIGQGKASLGMSADYQAAILAGADYIRIGTEIFGTRPAVAP
ncbi:MAG: YggS family pyridoxal phosphate-dependent enzyme [Zetaproteobacteria bacterium]|nr:YggS family pyridoxal phosphate-dependent enzyme [Zetaproteobacteria bacterium]